MGASEMDDDRIIANVNDNIATESCQLLDRYKCANCCSNLSISASGASVTREPGERTQSVHMNNKMLRVSSRFSSTSNWDNRTDTSSSIKTEEISIFDLVTKFYDYDFELCQNEIISELSTSQKKLLREKEIPLCMLCSAILHDLYRSFFEFNELRSNNSLLSKVCKIQSQFLANVNKNCDTIVPVSSTVSPTQSTITTGTCDSYDVINNNHKIFSTDEHEFILPHPIDSFVYNPNSNGHPLDTTEPEDIIEQFIENGNEPDYINNDEKLENQSEMTEPEEILGIDENDETCPLSPILGVEVGVNTNNSPLDVDCDYTTLLVQEPEHGPDSAGTYISDDQDPPILELQVNLDLEQTKITTRSFTCDHCKRTCENPETLQKHILKYHIGAFKCTICGKQFSTRENLQFHKEHVHSKNNMYSCELCKYKSHVKRYVVRHMTRKHKLNATKQPSTNHKH